MFKVRMLPRAIEDFERISDEYAAYSDASALKFIDSYLEIESLLKEMPAMYARSRDLPDYRRANINKYHCFFYKIDHVNQLVIIYRFLGSRMNYKQHEME